MDTLNIQKIKIKASYLKLTSELDEKEIWINVNFISAIGQVQDYCSITTIDGTYYKVKESATAIKAALSRNFGFSLIEVG